MWGDGPWFVAEADESDRSLLNLRARGARSCSNVDHDHHATFASLEEVRGGLPRVRGRACRADGVLVVGPDDRGPRAAPRRRRCAVRLVGDVPGAFCAGGARPGPPRLRRWCCAGGTREPVPLRLAGGPQRRQRRLRAGAGRLVRRAARPRRPPGLAGFTGVGRRMEARGAPAGVRGGGRLRPPPGRDPRHARRGPRARAPGGWSWCSSPTCPRAPGPSAPELAEALGAADVAIVTEVYLAREPADPAVSGRDVADAVPAAGAGRLRARRSPTRPTRRSPRRRPGDLLLTMGAGDITALGQELVARLERPLGDGDAHERTAPPA